jgi:2-keto-4-pentenoate hydratase/2-oxohepta-3-ene-1,7-dioic acid hydratase in catechol pathway
MRLVRFEDENGLGVGVRTDEELVWRTRWNSFDELFAEADPEAAVQALKVDPAAAVRPTRLLAPIVYRPQILGMGANYAAHTAEANRSNPVSEPIFFPFLWGAIIGPDEPIVIPTPDTVTDYEVEFSIVIGKTARGLTEENAMDYVFGYTIVNDVTAREIMKNEFMQSMLAKSVDTFVPVGPHIVTKDEIADPYTLKLATYVNGQIKQDSVTGTMTKRIVPLLVQLTRTVTLHPGDILTTGTPEGAGFFRDPPEILQDGDVIVCEVEGVGRLSNPVVNGW